jgi:flagella basal body P-ring formation protein FlgA
MYAGDFEKPLKANNNPLAEIVYDFLQSHFEITGEEFNLEFRHLPDSPAIRYPQAELKIISTPAQKYSGNIVVMVGAYEKGKEVKTFPVSVKVRSYNSVAVAINEVDVGEPLKLENFRLERREITNLNEEPITNLLLLLGKQAVRAIPSGSIVTKDELKPLSVVRQGDIVRIAIHTGNFLITALGRARKSGQVGEVIPVVNLSSHTEISARILDDKTVVIEY